MKLQTRTFQYGDVYFGRGFVKFSMDNQTHLQPPFENLPTFNN